jgi:hypothetical protein
MTHLASRWVATATSLCSMWILPMSGSLQMHCFVTAQRQLWFDLDRAITKLGIGIAVNAAAFDLGRVTQSTFWAEAT